MSDSTVIPTAAATQAGQYIRKGFGLKAEVQDTLAADYTGHLVRIGAECVEAGGGVLA
jgi:hypothetical protein